MKKVAGYPSGNLTCEPPGTPRPPSELPGINPVLPEDGGPGGVQLVRPKRASKIP